MRTGDFAHVVSHLGTSSRCVPDLRPQGCPPLKGDGTGHPNGRLVLRDTPSERERRETRVRVPSCAGRGGEAGAHADPGPLDPDGKPLHTSRSVVELADSVHRGQARKSLIDGSNRPARSIARRKKHKTLAIAANAHGCDTRSPLARGAA